MPNARRSLESSPGPCHISLHRNIPDLPYASRTPFVLTSSKPFPVPTRRGSRRPRRGARPAARIQPCASAGLSTRSGRIFRRPWTTTRSPPARPSATTHPAPAGSPRTTRRTTACSARSTTCTKWPCCSFCTAAWGMTSADTGCFWRTITLTNRPGDSTRSGFGNGARARSVSVVWSTLGSGWSNSPAWAQALPSESSSEGATGGSSRSIPWRRTSRSVTGSGPFGVDSRRESPYPQHRCRCRASGSSPSRCARR